MGIFLVTIFVIFTVVSIINKFYKLIVALLVIDIILFIHLLTGGFSWILDILGMFAIGAVLIMLVIYYQDKQREKERNGD